MPFLTCLRAFYTRLGAICFITQSCNKLKHKVQLCLGKDGHALGCIHRTSQRVGHLTELDLIFCHMFCSQTELAGLSSCPFRAIDCLSDYVIREDSTGNLAIIATNSVRPERTESGNTPII